MIEWEYVICKIIYRHSRYLSLSIDHLDRDICWLFQESTAFQRWPSDDSKWVYTVQLLVKFFVLKNREVKV